MQALVDKIIHDINNKVWSIDLDRNLKLILNSIKHGEIKVNAYRHKLDFICIESTIFCNTEYKFRIHIWDKAITLSNEFHNHRYEFTSYIFLGSLINNVAIFQRNKNGKFLRFLVSYLKNSSKRVVLKTRYNLLKIIVENQKQNSFYSSDRESFHSSTCLHTPSISIFCISLKDNKKSATLFADLTESEYYKPIKLTENEVYEAIEKNYPE